MRCKRLKRSVLRPRHLALSSEIAAADDELILDRLARLTDNLVLIPEAGCGRAAKRRPQLVLQLSDALRSKLRCDIVEIEPAAVHLSRRKAVLLRSLLPAVETGFGRLNRQLQRLQRTLRPGYPNWRQRIATSRSSRKGAQAQSRRSATSNNSKRQKQALRKSPERQDRTSHPGRVHCPKN